MTQNFDQLPEAAVLCAAAAPVPITWAQQMLQQHWGLDAVLEPVSGERDSNFSALALLDGAPVKLLFKASHPDEPALVTDYQTQALLHLARHFPGLPVQRLQATTSGAASISAVAPDGRPRVLRLLHWLHGLPMPQAPRSAAQRASVATLLARLDLALAGLRHPAAALQLPWDIQRAHSVASLVEEMPDADRRGLARAALQLFQTQALPQLSTLPRQAIHNDFNIHNLLVDPAQPDVASAILDFGDMLAAPRINDLAVAAAYQLDAEGGADSGADSGALSTVAAFAGAYHAQAPLQPAELDLLWPLVQARLLMVVAISGWRAARQPQDAAYLLRNNPISWARLQACAAVPPARARDAIHAACGA